MKNISIVLAVFALVFTSVSCETYDDYDADRAPIIGFTQANVNIKVREGSTRDKSVDVYISEAASVDRTFNVVVVADETEVAAENYSFTETVEILANERFGEVTITGIDVSLTEEKTPLTLQVQSGDGVISGAKVTAELFK
ncbi:hypothetical protein [Aequorivita marina]|uniref:hypothetical protein n=1 Tax=Aequorivita marina TaxID=3073654 RepID=UPI0028749B21|nr:hypothetical protein [Aequorivita sp. S2608]MDS1296933.1 hypothetical protein [Aequorivita sp. S2608]